MTEKEDREVAEWYCEEQGHGSTHPDGRFVPISYFIKTFLAGISHGRTTAKADREVLVKFLTFAKCPWTDATINELADEFLSALPNSGEDSEK